jgi:hypothetical protein
VTVQLIDDLTRISRTRLLRQSDAGRKSQQAGENKSTHHDLSSWWTVRRSTYAGIFGSGFFS